MTPETMEWIVRGAGIGQFALVAASVGIPKELKWKEELNRLRPLNRQIFIMQSAYILGIHFCMGVLSVAAPQLILDGSTLAACVTGFVAVYWTTRLGLQFLYVDHSDVPPGLKFKLAEVVFAGLFLLFAVVFGYAMYFNITEAA